ncbi:MAG: hypothetical protein P8Y62_10845, partial [candidate division WOR-3 bacterium]
LGLKKDYRQSLIKLAKQRIKEKEYPDAIKFLKEALAIKDDQNIKIILARILELAGNINDALAIYKELHSNNKANPFYLLKIGTIEKRVGKKEKAEKYFRKAVRISKGKIKEQALYALGYLLIKEERLDEASRLISQYEETEKKMPLRLRFIEGRLLCAKGEFEKTLEIVREELKKELSPEMKRDFLVLGGLAKQGNENHLEAINFINKSIDIAKNKGDIINEASFMTGKGVSLLSLDRYMEALEELEESLKLVRKLKIKNLEYYCLLNLSNVYLRMGYWEKLKERTIDFGKRYGKVSPFLREKLLEGELYRGKWTEAEKIKEELKEEKYDLKEGEGIFLIFKGECRKSEKVLRKTFEKRKGEPTEKRDNIRRLS